VAQFKRLYPCYAISREGDCVPEVQSDKKAWILSIQLLATPSLLVSCRTSPSSRSWRWATPSPSWTSPASSAAGASPTPPSSPRRGRGRRRAPFPWRSPSYGSRRGRRVRVILRRLSGGHVAAAPGVRGGPRRVAPARPRACLPPTGSRPSRSASRACRSWARPRSLTSSGRSACVTGPDPRHRNKAAPV
jgi:hypothetical protein